MKDEREMGEKVNTFFYLCEGQPEFKENWRKS